MMSMVGIELLQGLPLKAGIRVGRFTSHVGSHTCQHKSRAKAAKHSGNWEMHINWILEHELDLHNLLKHWAQNGVSAQQIGESLANMFY